MHRIAGLVASVATLSALTLGVSTYQRAQAQSPQSPVHAAVSVTIQNFAFSPANLTVASGTTVTWTNMDSAPHTVTSTTSAWPDSGNLSTSQTFSHTFTKAGTFAYFCAVHPNMKATITVTAASSSAPAAASAAPVKLAPAKILMSPKGLALYVFAKDPADKSTCYSTCAKYWPPLLAPKGMAATTKVAGIPGTFGVIKRTDGTSQVTYDHAPLYTFVQDKDSGDSYGQGVVASGGFWWLVVAGGK